MTLTLWTVRGIVVKAKQKQNNTPAWPDLACPALPCLWSTHIPLHLLALVTVNTRQMIAPTCARVKLRVEPEKGMQTKWKAQTKLLKRSQQKGQQIPLNGVRKAKETEVHEKSTRRETQRYFPSESVVAKGHKGYNEAAMGLIQSRNWQKPRNYFGETTLHIYPAVQLLLLQGILTTWQQLLKVRQTNLFIFGPGSLPQGLTVCHLLNRLLWVQSTVEKP